MRTVDIETTAYPRIKTNLTDKQIIETYTLSPEEIGLVRDYRGDVLALAVRMKCFEHLMNHNFSLSDVPQKAVDYVASQLQIAHFLSKKKRIPGLSRFSSSANVPGFPPFHKQNARSF